MQEPAVLCLEPILLFTIDATLHVCLQTAKHDKVRLNTKSLYVWLLCMCTWQRNPLAVQWAYTSTGCCACALRNLRDLFAGNEQCQLAH